LLKLYDYETGRQINNSYRIDKFSVDSNLSSATPIDTRMGLGQLGGTSVQSELILDACPLFLIMKSKNLKGVPEEILLTFPRQGVEWNKACREEGEEGWAAGCCIAEGGPGLACGGFLRRQWLRDRRDKFFGKRVRGKVFTYLRIAICRPYLP